MYRILCICVFLLATVLGRAQEKQPGGAYASQLKTSYMQLNPVAMSVYHELDSIFPLRFLANEGPADCGYWVNQFFSSEQDFEKYRPWLESLAGRLQQMKCYQSDVQRKDSGSVFEYSLTARCVTADPLQQDQLYFAFSREGASFYYRAHISGADFCYDGQSNDLNGQPRQDIADAMDALLQKYTGRKDAAKEKVVYDQTKVNYKYLTFISLGTWTSAGYRYVVPRCTEADYLRLRQAIASYSRTSPVRTSFNDVYWQYEEAAICIARPGKPALMIGVALKGTDLYILRIEGTQRYLMPRAWPEESPVWETKKYYRLTARKPLDPPAVK